MLVETFECQETVDESVEQTEEALELIESLGLEGQKSLTCKVKGSETRCPYREITAEEMFVYRTLCPVAVEISKYTAAPIPLRVLQVASHAQSLGLFKNLIVWDRESVTVKDPVLLGSTGDHWEYSWSNSKLFILARWGEELEAFATLVKRACVIRREQLTQSAEECLNKVRLATDSQLIKAGPLAQVSSPLS